MLLHFQCRDLLVEHRCNYKETKQGGGELRLFHWQDVSLEETYAVLMNVMSWVCISNESEFRTSIGSDPGVRRPAPSRITF